MINAQEILDVARAVAWAVFEERIKHEPWVDSIHSSFPWKGRMIHMIIHKPRFETHDPCMHIDVVVQIPYDVAGQKITVNIGPTP